jgi:hypothetical protein
MFGYKLIHKDELDDLIKCRIKFNKVRQVHRCFAGWKDLDIIWDYIMPENYFGDIFSCRDKYAEARKTTVYGEPNE